MPRGWLNRFGILYKVMAFEVPYHGARSLIRRSHAELIEGDADWICPPFPSRRRAGASGFPPSSRARSLFGIGRSRGTLAEGGSLADRASNHFLCPVGVRAGFSCALARCSPQSRARQLGG